MQKTLIAAALALASLPVLAQDVSPGLWEIQMETRVPSSPEFQPAPYKMTQCFTAADAKDPGALFYKIGNPGASNCRFQDRNYHGSDSFTFSMTCAGTYNLRSTGEVKFTKDTMDGTVNAIANIGDKDVETQNKLSARRVGGC
jgi:hypothetical protein